ncbi:PREDICTED: putative ubiquitin carboxyl-terminal hydrolase 50 [Apaloderma vittatum]|uniref:putative ubiquitin carboxyl-terminal hydrolase 50 n=1 Tax=Apaloderma vittatum TaxID=57397 RepID=UPI0005213B1E|nr:PREDICTED: putative ubiquitin carboxyl-terminal hydrolase 50 [Apaloderma vittatum]
MRVRRGVINTAHVSAHPPGVSAKHPLGGLRLELCEKLREAWKYDSIFLGKVKHCCKEAMEEMNGQYPGLTGLRNLGKTCYMNAILQCLCSVPPLVEYFLSGKYKAALREENGESAAAFGCLMSNMWLEESDSVSPEVFQSVLEKRYPTFSNSTQQDAHEFLICVLNELHDALKKCSKKRRITNAKVSRGSVSETSIITQLFEGQLRYDITCLACKTAIHRPESFTVLSLPIPSQSVCSLQDCLKCFFQQDTLTWNNQIHCSQCEKKNDAVVKATITKAPQIIIFHLKRFEWQGNHRRKLSTDICYPLSNLDLSPYSSPPSCLDAEYSLCAVVNHNGFLDGGHYTAFCKHSITNNWYSFNDVQITKIPNSSVQTDTAYLLFYRKDLCIH